MFVGSDLLFRYPSILAVSYSGDLTATSAYRMMGDLHRDFVGEVLVHNQCEARTGEILQLWRTATDVIPARRCLAFRQSFLKLFEHQIARTVPEMNDDKANRLREEALLNQRRRPVFSERLPSTRGYRPLQVRSLWEGVARRSSLSWRVDGHGNDVVATSRHGTRSNHAECNQLCHIINR